MFHSLDVPCSYDNHLLFILILYLLLMGYLPLMRHLLVISKNS